MWVAGCDSGAKLKTQICMRTPPSVTGSGYPNWDLTPMFFNQTEDPDQQLQLLRDTR